MQGYYHGSFGRAEKQISAEKNTEAAGMPKECRGKLSLQVNYNETLAPG